MNVHHDIEEIGVISLNIRRLLRTFGEKSSKKGIENFVIAEIMTFLSFLIKRDRNNAKVNVVNKLNIFSE
jgi:hypothetical protein